jgi:hypothetical protein
LNPGIRGGKPATNRLRYGADSSLLDPNVLRQDTIVRKIGKNDAVTLCVRKDHLMSRRCLCVDILASAPLVNFEGTVDAGVPGRIKVKKIILTVLLTLCNTHSFIMLGKKKHD